MWGVGGCGAEGAGEGVRGVLYVGCGLNYIPGDKVILDHSMDVSERLQRRVPSTCKADFFARRWDALGHENGHQRHDGCSLVGAARKVVTHL